MANFEENVEGNVVKNKLKQYNLTTSLEKNIEMFKDNIFKGDNSIIYRRVKNKLTNLEFCLIFVDGMVKNEIINKNIIYELINNNININSNELINELKEQVIIASDVYETKIVDEIVSSVLYGDCLLLINNFNSALVINAKGWKTRAISEPTSETIITGPREGFTESLNDNMILIRRKIKSSDLKFKVREIGARTRTNITIAYMEGIVNECILKELESRIDRIDIDGIFSTETIREYVCDNPNSAFKTIGNTERPDVVASKLLEGRIAILCDGSPVALTLPYLFVEYFQVNEDYYDNYIYASINRLLRIIAFVITIAVPGLYVAVVSFHKELIPTRLALSIYFSNKNVPFPLIVEAFVLLIVFEILREAGVRLPKHIGSTVSIVGALILGDAAVNANFVSAPMVIIIGITAICELVLIEMRTAILVVRTVFLFAASLLGIYGVIFSTMGLVIYLMSIKCFGIPYMLKYIELDKYNIADTTIRAPWWLLKYRTKFISKDFRRSSNKLKEGINNEKASKKNN